jgi:hypothetical protein
LRLMGLSLDRSVSRRIRSSALAALAALARSIISRFESRSAVWLLRQDQMLPVKNISGISHQQHRSSLSSALSQLTNWTMPN